MASLDQIMPGARMVFWSSAHNAEKEGIFLFWVSTPGVRYAQVCYDQGKNQPILGVRGIHESRVRRFQNIERYEPMQEVQDGNSGDQV